MAPTILHRYSHSPKQASNDMCTRVIHVYQCGCRNKGELKQCDRLYGQESNLQCDVTEVESMIARNYCSKHMPKENKAKAAYVGRAPQQ